MEQPHEYMAENAVCSQENSRPLSFVFEINGHKFRSLREPRSYEELVSASLSLLRHQELLLGMAVNFNGKDKGSGAIKSMANHIHDAGQIALVCQESNLIVSGQEVFQRLKSQIWLELADDHQVLITVQPKSKPSQAS